MVYSIFNHEKQGLLLKGKLPGTKRTVPREKKQVTFHLQHALGGAEKRGTCVIHSTI